MMMMMMIITPEKMKKKKITDHTKALMMIILEKMLMTVVVVVVVVVSSLKITCFITFKSLHYVRFNKFIIIRVIINFKCKYLNEYVSSKYVVCNI